MSQRKDTTHQPAPSVLLPNLLEEMGRLLDADLEPRGFFQAYVAHTITAVQAMGGAVWQRTPAGDFVQAYALNWNALAMEAIPEGLSCHQQVLQVAAQRERALWVPPHSGRKLVGDDQQAANLSALALLLAPVFMDKQVAGLVEVWLLPEIEEASRHERARFLTEMTGFVAAFMQKHQLKSLLQQQRLWHQWTSLHQQIHSSLDPRIVARTIADEGRRLLQCDQLNVALRRSGKTEILAMSGFSSFERKGRLAQALEVLSDQVIYWGEKLVFDGNRDETIPINIMQSLDGYLAENPVRSLIVWPIFDVRNAEAIESCGALIAESHDPTLSIDRLQERMQGLVESAGPALANARYVAQMPLHRISKTLAAVGNWTLKRTLLRISIYALPLFMLVGMLIFVQIPLRLESKGQLLPVQRHIVFSPLHGKVLELKAKHGDRVEKGQELLLMENLDAQLQIDQLVLKISSAEQRMALLSEQIGKSTNNEDRNTLTKDRIQQEFEMRRAMAERDILAQGSRNPRKTPVLAPISGKIVTFDAQEQLLGKTVKPGDPLLRVAAVKGVWEVELRIPERYLGSIREGLRSSPDKFVEVSLLLANQPQRSYTGRLKIDGLGGETSVKDNSVVLPARVQITDAEMVSQLESLPVGLEVRSKIHCGSHALGQVWFYEIWEFFYEHVLF